MLRMVSYSHRLKSGQITCYLNRTYHVLTTEMVAEGDYGGRKVYYAGAHRGTGGDLIPARPSVLNQGGQSFETSGTGLVRASFCG